MGWYYPLVSCMMMILLVKISGENIEQELKISWGDDRGKILNNGQLLTLSLDNSSGSGFQSNNKYLFGKIDMQIKLVPGNSAGTVTAYFLSSKEDDESKADDDHDEIDYEFLGNLTGHPYTVHTNVFTRGKGEKEQQFHLWFDPTADFHTYSIIWNPQTIIFAIDEIPIREHKNRESMGIPFPNKRPMRLFSSLWNAEDWATQGGRVKTDWTQSPFSASYRNFKAEACVRVAEKTLCAPETRAWMTKKLDGPSLNKLKWVKKKFMIYNYCVDAKRFPQGLPKECRATKN